MAGDGNVWSVEKSLLLATNLQESGKLFHNKSEVCDILCKDITDGEFLSTLTSAHCQDVFSKCGLEMDTETLEDGLKKSADLWLAENPSESRQLDVLSLGISALLAFVQDNWTGPSLSSNDCCIPWLLQLLPSVTKEGLLSSIELDGESVCSVVRHPELLLLARAALFSNLSNLESTPWWQLRCLVVHQQILDEWSSELHTLLRALAERLPLSERLTGDSQLQIILHLEIAQMHLVYHEIQPSSAALQSALKAAEMSMDLIGALGRRTRFQYKEVAQLTLRIQTSGEDIVQSSPDLPKDLTLTDDVRLNKIAYSNALDGQFASLSPVQQACVLGMFIQTQRSQPKDKLADEELMAYLSCLLAQPCVWSFQLACLLFRSKIEANHSRTVERSMMQTQALLDAVEAKAPQVWHRLKLFFCSHLCPRWKLEEELAGLLVSLGCVNSALDIYLRLQAWEEVIACYNHLQLRHKAAEVIRQEMEKKETVKLWCLLGDATDDIGCYQKAWILSSERSGRAQRHWGLYFFNRKQYEEALPHLELSLKLNSLQVPLWFQLGYAALHQENWTVAATAYRRYCTLDPENCEAWNNLAKAYVKQGQKNRAWKALQEALKWNYENWRVWDNFMVVSVDCAVMDEVIRAYNRVLDLKERHVDIEVLEILGKAVIENLSDNEGQPCRRLLNKLLTLLGRLTAQVQSEWKIWHLYSRLTACVLPSTPESELRSVQQMQKAYRASVANASWVRDSEFCQQVMKTTADLANVSLDYADKNSSTNQTQSVLSSVRLALKAVLSKMKQERLDLLTNQIEADFVEGYQKLEALLEKVLQEAQQK